MGRRPGAVLLRPLVGVRGAALDGALFYCFRAKRIEARQAWLARLSAPYGEDE